MAEIIQFPRRPDPGLRLSKRQLARHLGRSTRWVELRVREGMPASLDRRGYRSFVLAEVEEWLARREAS